jgi:iron complex outermembrane receptor protein
MRFSRLFLFSLLLGLIVALAPEAAGAQTASLQEIVVTAARRESGWLSVPGAVSALGRGDLTNQRVTQPLDLAARLGNVEVSEPLGNPFSMFIIRGIGLNDFNTNNTPAVAVFSDDVYRSSNALTPRRLFDLERIEVMKGPQGALFGRNTTGGAVQLITASPGARPESYAQFTFENYETVTGEAAVSAPLGPKAGLRVAGFADRRFKGPQFNRFLNERHGEIRAYGLRTTLTLRPSEAFDVLANGEIGRNFSDVLHFQHRGLVGPQCQAITRGIHDPALCRDALGYADTDGNVNAGDYDSRPRLFDRTNHAMLRARYRAHSWTLVSISSFGRARLISRRDSDAAPVLLLHINYRTAINEAAQEVRLLGPEDGPWRWLIGGTLARYLHDEFRDARTDEAERRFGPIFGTPISQLPYRQLTVTRSVYGDLSRELGGGWTAQATLRFTDERIAYRGGTRLPTFGIDIVHVTDSVSETDLSWRAALLYRLHADTQIYAQSSRGYKSGGFFGGFAFNPAVLAPYGKETLWANEVGVKHAGRTVQAQLSAFHYRYRDLQAVVPGSVGQGVTTPTLRNLPGAELLGLDGEITTRLTAGLDLRAALGLLHSKLRGPAFSFGSGGPAGPLFDIAGNRLPRAPSVSASLGLVGERAVTPDWNAQATLSLSLRSPLYVSLLNEPMGRQATTATVNASLGFTRADGRWSARLFVTNATGVQPLLADAPAGFGERDVEIYGPPRRYGLELRAAF